MFLRFSRVILCLAKKSFFGSVFALCLLSLSGICDVYAQGPMPHVVDRATALSLARAQGKLVLMISGFEGCGNCALVEANLTDVISCPLRPLVEEIFVYWYCDVHTSCKAEMDIYNKGAGSSNALPMILVIDPFAENSLEDACKSRSGMSSDKCLLREYGNFNSLPLYEDFKKAGLRGEAPIVTNLKDGDEIDPAQPVITGKMPWKSVPIEAMVYSLNGSTEVSVANKDPTNWNIALDAGKLKKGNNIIKISARTPVSRSKPVTLSFNYHS